MVISFEELVVVIVQRKFRRSGEGFMEKAPPFNVRGARVTLVLIL